MRVAATGPACDRSFLSGIEQRRKCIDVLLADVICYIPATRLISYRFSVSPCPCPSAFQKILCWERESETSKYNDRDVNMFYRGAVRC